MGVQDLASVWVIGPCGAEGSNDQRFAGISAMEEGVEFWGSVVENNDHRGDKH